MAYCKKNHTNHKNWRTIHDMEEAKIAKVTGGGGGDGYTIQKLPIRGTAEYTVYRNEILNTFYVYLQLEWNAVFLSSPGPTKILARVMKTPIGNPESKQGYEFTVPVKLGLRACSICTLKKLSTDLLLNINIQEAFMSKCKIRLRQCADYFYGLSVYGWHAPKCPSTTDPRQRTVLFSIFNCKKLPQCVNLLN